MLEEGLLDVGIDLLGRELADLVEIDLDAFHAEHVEARLDEIFREQVVDAADKVSRAQDLLRLERVQCPHVVGARGEERELVLLLPLLQELGLAFESEQHEGRCAFRMDEVASGVRKLPDQRLIRRSRALELFRRAVADVEEQRQHADALRQHADQLLEPARPQRRLDAANDAAPTRECHGWSPLVSCLSALCLLASYLLASWRANALAAPSRSGSSRRTILQGGDGSLVKP